MVPPQGTPVRYSKAIQLMHELTGALLCIDVREQLAKEGFAMKVVLKTVEPPSGAVHLCMKRFQSRCGPECESLCCLTCPFPIIYVVFGCKSYAQNGVSFPSVILARWLDLLLIFETGGTVVSDEWSDTWWELRPPGNVRISQARPFLL